MHGDDVQLQPTMFSYLASEERIVDGVRACRAKPNLERDILDRPGPDSFLRRFECQ